MMRDLNFGVVLQASVAILYSGYFWKGTTFAETHGTRTWRGFSAASPVNTTDLVIIKSESAAACSILASRYFFDANFFCSGLGRCMYGRVYLPILAGEQTEGYKCYASYDCLSDGKMYVEHDVVQNPDCPFFDEICTKEGFKPRGELVRHRRRCDSPFTQFPFGCLYFNTTKRNLESSIEFCESLGSSLASMDTPEEFEGMKAYLSSLYVNTTDDFWVYVSRVYGHWTWPKNGRLVVGPAFSGEWGSKDPDGQPGKQCVRVRSLTAFFLTDTNGQNTFGTACHVWYL